MRFARGSHRWGLLNQGNFYGQDADLMRSAIRVPEGENWSEVEAVLPAGGISFHNCLTFHGSGPNHSEQPRRSFAVHLRTEKSRPKNDQRAGLTQYIDDHALCPIIYRAQDVVEA
jgi:ectoine hydroxylase-related dioxygenase (phytanoyl-CoA dioxygenase family)